MMELAGFAITDVGAGALVVGFVVAIATGRLVPKGRADRELDFRDRMVEMIRAEADSWKAAAAEANKVSAIVRQENVEQREQISRLVATGEEHVKLIAAMREFVSFAGANGNGG